MQIKNEMIYKEFVQREEQFVHCSYSEELDFYHNIKEGNVELLEELRGVDFSLQKGLGSLSDDKVQNAKYHLVIATAMTARYCMEAGMEHEAAFTASDMFIKKADKCTTTMDISKVQFDMAMYYAKYMKKLRTSRVYSLPITKCIDYIYNHLHKKISLAELCEVCGLSEGYLSRLFKSETGKTVTAYVREKKLDTAKNMLAHSDYPMSMISEVLSFASQSHFIRQFKEQEGITPMQYRKYYTRELELQGVRKSFSNDGR